MTFWYQSPARFIGGLVVVLLLVFSALPAWCGPPTEVMTPSEKNPGRGESEGSPKPADSPDTPDTMVTGVVLELKEKPVLPESQQFGDVSALSMNERVQIAKVRVTSGELKGRTVTVENVRGENPIYNIPLEKGARVLLYVEKTPDGRHQVYISNRDRMPALMLLFGTFLLALLLVGGKRTFRHGVLTAFALLLLTRSVVPPLLGGEPGSFMSIVLALLVALVGCMLLLPDNRQTPRIMLLVILATLVNVTILLLIIFLVAVLAPLHGFFSESMATLWYQYPRLNFQQMLFATAVVSHLGLLFFITLTIVQTCLTAAEPENADSGPVFQAGLKQGQVLLGPILLSVSLLYAGLYFPNLLQGAESTLLDTLNLEVYATYAAIVLSGALSMVLAIPATAGLSSWLLRKKAG